MSAIEHSSLRCPTFPAERRDAQPAPSATPPLSGLPQLYQRLGYTEVGRDPMFTPNRRCLMRKDVEALRCTPKSSSYGNLSLASRLSSGGGGSGRGAASEGSRSGGARGGGGGGGGGSGGGAGVFVWSDVDFAGADPEGAAAEQAPGGGGHPRQQA